jgi:hypothetical protein
MSSFTCLQIVEVGERGETGLSLADTIAVVFGVDEVKAQKLSLDPAIRKAHSDGRTKGVAAVMEGLSDAARKGSASAAATLLKASAISLEQEAKIDYEIEVAHKARKTIDVSASVKAGFEIQRQLLSEPIECRNATIGPNGVMLYIGDVYYV